MKAKLGDKVKDKVTGFKGIIVSEHRYLNGCARMTVQPEMKKDGTLPQPQTFDVPQLKVIKPQVAESEPIMGRTGGPDKFQDEGRD